MCVSGPNDSYFQFYIILIVPLCKLDPNVSNFCHSDTLENEKGNIRNYWCDSDLKHHEDNTWCYKWGK